MRGPAVPVLLYGALGGAVLNAFQVPNTTQWLIMGGFTNYANAGLVFPTYRFVRANQDGSWDRSFQVIMYFMPFFLREFPALSESNIQRLCRRCLKGARAATHDRTL